MTRSVIAVIMIVVGLLIFHFSSYYPVTSEIWKVYHPYGILSESVQAGDRALFPAGAKELGKRVLLSVDEKGNLVESMQLPAEPHPLLGFRDTVIVTDKSGVLRAVAIPENKVLWERGTLVPPRIPPIKIGDEWVVIPSTLSIAFCLGYKSGDPLWEATFDGKILYMTADKTLAFVHQHTEEGRTCWRLSGVDPEDGSILWTYPGFIAAEPPECFQGLFVVCDSTGRPIGIDQVSGETVFRHPTDGLKIAGISDDMLLLLGAGGSRIEVLNLVDNKAWSATLPSSYINGAVSGDRLIIADKRGIRCVQASTGNHIWDKTLGEVFNCFPHRNGLAVTFKESFIAATTYFSYFEADKGECIWNVADQGIFFRPMPFAGGDLVLCKSGSIRLMPIPEGHQPNSGKKTVINGNRFDFEKLKQIK